ncbi:MAG: CrcB family protein [Acidimicrobiales bacterium]|nr:CrcB family protein [Acidimicrobiales bacterium]
MIVVGFVVAAGIGAGARWYLGGALGRLGGTMVANTLGSFILGLLVGQSTGTSTVVGVAGLGALTTWSTLMSQIAELVRTDRERALRYGAVSIIGGVAAAWLGLKMG